MDVPIVNENVQCEAGTEIESTPYFDLEVSKVVVSVEAGQ